MTLNLNTEHKNTNLRTFDNEVSKDEEQSSEPFELAIFERKRKYNGRSIKISSGDFSIS